MKSHRLAAISRNAITSLLLILASGYSGFAQTPAPPPTLAPPLISLAEARAIIDGAVAFTRDQNLNMAVVVVDAAGNLVSADKMDGTTINNTRFAEGKAFASAILRQTTEVLANLAKGRPDRYFGIMNMYPGKVYLVGGGVPLTIDGRLVGAVGVAGLPQGVDEKAARAGIAAWEKFRENMKKYLRRSPRQRLTNSTAGQKWARVSISRCRRNVKSKSPYLSSAKKNLTRCCDVGVPNRRTPI